jgi:L,D-peptidoglycan transpeptidase YkuD (ErfK/YbiS/YcfS/YnhG family)
MDTARCRQALGVAFFLIVSNACAEGVPDNCTQLVLGIAPTWNSMHGRLQLFQRSRGEDWQPASPAVAVLFGKDGVAWGSGLSGQGELGLHKKERDGRAPAGVFRIGKIYTYDAQLPPGSNYPFHQVSQTDAWVDDVNSPDYNRFVTIDDPSRPPLWFEKQKMRHNDFAYRWLVEIRHNSDPPVPGAGSAIFFHIRRGANRATSGCTTMAEADLVRLITWLRADRNPCYALLPAGEYNKKWHLWNLPKPDKVAKQ